MSGAQSMWTATVVAISLAVVGCIPGESPKPNLIVICLDAVRKDALTPYGASPTATPQLELLARRGVVFDNAFSVASWTRPSVPSILTGLYPRQHGMQTSGDRQVDVIPDEVTTLAERLRASGYATAAFVNNEHLQRRYSALDQGFDTYVEEAGEAPTLIEAFLSWTETVKARPFFVYLHILDPHWPYTPPPAVLGSLPTGARLRSIYVDLAASRWRLVRNAVNSRRTVLAPHVLGELRTLYDAEIASTDAAIGRAIELLDSRGTVDNTLVVVTADHGEGFGEHGYLDHGYGPYDELLRVPLIVRFPHDRHAGMRVAVSAQVVDIAPTILSYVGLDLPIGGGRSLLPAIDGSDVFADRAVFSEEQHGDTRMTAVRTNSYKYIRTEQLAPPPAPRAMLPVDLKVGARVRIEGVFADPDFVTDAVHLIDAGDTDCEIYAPVASVTGDGQLVTLLGTAVRIDPQSTRLRTAAGKHVDGTLAPFQWIRAHGQATGQQLVATKIETQGDKPATEIELEGIVESVAPEANGGADFSVCGYRVIIDPETQWKAFEGPFETVPAPSRRTDVDAAAEELYDLTNDPEERTNLAQRPSEPLSAMRERLRSVLTEIDRGVVARTRITVDLDAGTRDRLKALGYIE